MSSNVVPASSVQRSPEDETNPSTREEVLQKEARLREKFFMTKLSKEEETVVGQDSGEKNGGGEAAPPLNDMMKEKSVPREEAPKGGLVLRSALEVERKKRLREVNPILEALATAVLLERPDDPVHFMIKWLSEQTTEKLNTGQELERLQNEIERLKARQRELQNLSNAAGGSEGALSEEPPDQGKSAAASTEAPAALDDEEEEEDDDDDMEGITMNRPMLGPTSVDTRSPSPSIDESQEPRTTTIDVKRSMQIKMEEQQQRKKQKQQEVISKQLAPAGSVSKEKKKEPQATPGVSEFIALREKLLASTLRKNPTSNSSSPSPSENTTKADNAQTVVPPSGVSIQSSENLTSTPPEGSVTTSGWKKSRDEKNDDDDSRSSRKRRKEAKAREGDGTGGSKKEGITINPPMLGPTSGDTRSPSPSIDESQEPRTTINVKRNMQIKMEEQRKKQKQQEVISKQLPPAANVSKEKKKEAQATAVVSDFDALRAKLQTSILRKNPTSNPSPPSPSENTSSDNDLTVVSPSAVSIQSSENLTSTPPEGSATTSGRKQSRDKKDDDDDSRSSIKRRKEAKAREDDGTGGSKNHRDVDYRTRASSSAGDSSRIEPVIIEDCAENRGEQVIHGELAGQSTLEKVILAFLNMIDNIPSENSFNRLIDVIPEHFRKLVIPYRDRCSSAAPTRPRASSAPDSPPFDFDSWRFEPKPMQGA